ncbi:TrbG/VirB9 family P-type conjugative transfer protein [Komagataeibacter oboediens]|nr:TrbG/VirB9 family P-type conjugative transfer protein [Komagataeibacter oboediens]
MPQGITREFNASVNVSAHLIFPLPLAHAMISTKLWTEEHHGNDLWVRPNQDTHMADKVGLSVSMVDGRRYDFTVQSVPNSTPCYLVVPYPFLSPNASSLTPEQLAQAQQAAEEARKQKAAAAAAWRASEAKRHADEQAAYQKQFDAMRSQVIQQAEDRIKQFQHSLHTAYTWKNHRLIPSVYDDGETTYVRVYQSGYGVPVITGSHDGQDVAVQSDYDDMTGIYVIPGLYDRINVRLGTNRIRIVRGG